MLDRVLKIFRGGSAVYTDECLLFAKKHCFVISLLIMVAAVTGLWIMFFQLGVVIFQFAFLPGVCSLLFLYFSSNPHQKGSLSSGFVMGAFFAAVSFATGAGIPAYFYGTVGGGWGGQLSEPTWYLVALVILCMFSRKRWSEEEDEDGQDSADRDMVSLVWMGVIVIYVVFCLAAAAREYTGDAWIYYGLAMAGGIHVCAGQAEDEHASPPPAHAILGGADFPIAVERYSGAGFLLIGWADSCYGARQNTGKLKK